MSNPFHWSAATRRLVLVLASMVACQCSSGPHQQGGGGGGQLLFGKAEQLQLSTLLPKLQAIHEDAKSLLIKNAELKGKILAGLLAQTDAKVREMKKIQLLTVPLLGANASATSNQPDNNNNNQQHHGYQHHQPALVVPVNHKLVEQAEKQIIGLNPQQAQPTPTSPSQPSPAPTSKPMSQTPTTNTKPIEGQHSDNKRHIDYVELDEFNRWVEKNLEYAVKNTQATAEALRDEAQQNNGNVDYSEQAIKDGIEGVKYWQQAVIFQDKTLKNERFETMD